MLKCCDSDGEYILVLEFFAVDNHLTALLCHAVNGGGRLLRHFLFCFWASFSGYFFTSFFHSSLYTTSNQLLEFAFRAL